MLREIKNLSDEEVTARMMAIQTGMTPEQRTEFRKAIDKRASPEEQLKILLGEIKNLSDDEVTERMMAIQTGMTPAQRTEFQIAIDKRASRA